MFCAQLEVMQLTENRLGAEGLRMILRASEGDDAPSERISKSLGSLKRLVVQNNGLGDEGCRELAIWMSPSTSTGPAHLTQVAAL